MIDETDKKDKTLYVVSGFMRTGTSMMMKALEAGGLETAYKQSREEMRLKFADEHYDPNIGGLYELERADYQEKGFPKKYAGKLIKALNMAIPGMDVMDDRIKVVYMRRDTEEIRQSYDAFFGHQLNKKVIENLQEIQSNIIERIKNRKDVLSINVFWFRNVINNPLKHFNILKQNGWNIDVEKAVEVVDPEYYRFRLENLTVGVY